MWLPGRGGGDRGHAGGWEGGGKGRANTKQIHPEQYIYDVQTIYVTIICLNLLT